MYWLILFVNCCDAAVPPSVSGTSPWVTFQIRAVGHTGWGGHGDRGIAGEAEIFYMRPT